MTVRLNTLFQRVPEGYVGWVEEIPHTNVQQASLDEARESLVEAVELVLAANRELARAALGEEAEVIRELRRLDPAA